MQPIGHIRSPYKDTREIPKGLGAKHEVEGSLEIRAEFEPGLKDIEGFSHLIVIWVFDRSTGFDLAGTPPSDDRPHGVFDPLTAATESNWINGRRTSRPRGSGTPRAWYRHA